MANEIDLKIELEKIPGFTEFITMVREAAEEKKKVIPKYCPFDNTRGCIRGDVWIVKQIEHETCFETVETKINGRACQAWSSELGRCLRIEPVNQQERGRLNENGLNKVSGCGCCSDITDKTMRM